MALSETVREALEEAAKAAHAAGVKAQTLQAMAPRVTPEGAEAFVIEVSVARAEAIAAKRVLEALISSS